MEMATAARRRGPVEGEQVIGVDRDPTSRPGVPMQPEPVDGAAGAPDRDVIEQGDDGRTLTRAALDAPTPVFGSTLPPHGISGVIRRAAYGIPEHYARHWMLLLLADRVDTLEDRLGGVLARPLEARGADGAAARVRSNPAGILLATAAGIWLGKRLLG